MCSGCDCRATHCIATFTSCFHNVSLADSFGQTDGVGYGKIPSSDVSRLQARQLGLVAARIPGAETPDNRSAAGVMRLFWPHQCNYGRWYKGSARGYESVPRLPCLGGRMRTFLTGVGLLILLPAEVSGAGSMDRVSQCMFDYSKKLVDTQQTAEAISYYVADKCLELKDPPLCRNTNTDGCTAIDVEADGKIRALTIDFVYKIISGWRRGAPTPHPPPPPSPPLPAGSAPRP